MATDSREANHEIGQMAHGHGALGNDITGLRNVISGASSEYVGGNWS